MKNNAIRMFHTEEEAKTFAEKVNSNNWGWMKDKNGVIVEWYVEYFETFHNGAWTE